MIDRHAIELVGFIAILVGWLVVGFVQVRAKHRGDSLRVGHLEVTRRSLLLLIIALSTAASPSFVLRLLGACCVSYMAVSVVLA